MFLSLKLFVTVTLLMSKQSDNEQVMTKNPSSSTSGESHLSRRSQYLDLQLVALILFVFFVSLSLSISLHGDIRNQTMLTLQVEYDAVPCHREDVSKVQTPGSHYCHLLRPQWSPTHSLVMPKNKKKCFFWNI